MLQSPLRPALMSSLQPTADAVNAGPTRVAAPRFSPAAGAYGPTQNVTITSATVGATIHYTDDGSEPDAGSTEYTGAISVSTTKTLKAIAIDGVLLDSAVTSATYAINGAVATPAISPAAGTYNDDQTVTITCATGGAAIYYTTDGSAPDATKTLYTGGFTLNASATVKAIGIKATYTNSAVASNAITLQVATPTFSPVAGSYAGAQSVSISTTTAGDTIRYTVDGSTPDGSSTVYSSAISVSASQTVKAIGIKAGYSNSAVGSAAYVIGDADASAWAAAVAGAGGTYSAGTLDAVNAFCVAAKANSYWTKLNRINLMCGDQLTAALVPLKVGAGSATDTNVNFVSGDYTEATGLTGNGSSKYLNTGMLATALTLNDSSQGVYNRSSTAASGGASIGSDDATESFRFFAPLTDGKGYSDQYNGANGRVVSASALSTPYGFLVSSRTASNSHVLYRNGTSIVSSATSTSLGTLPTGRNIYVCARNANGTPANYISQPLAAYFIGAGLTQSDVTNFNADMQAFQLALSRNV